MSWSDYIGSQLIDSVSFEINGQTLDTCSNETMNMWLELSKPICTFCNKTVHKGKFEYHTQCYRDRHKILSTEIIEDIIPFILGKINGGIAIRYGSQKRRSQLEGYYNK